MHAPALAPAFGLCWHLWRRHRRGLTVVLAFLMILAIAGILVPAESVRTGVVVAATLIPLLGILIYLMAIFANPDADVISSSSEYPAYLLLLPANTRQLVFWPMLYGTAGAAAAWLIVVEAVFAPRGIAVPAAWQAAMFAAIVAVLQAVLWSPLGLPYLRLILELTLIPGLVAMGFLLPGVAAKSWPGFHAAHPALSLTAPFLAVIALSYLAAVRGLSLARRGDTPRWQPLTRIPWRAAASSRVSREAADRAFRDVKPFASPMAAQLWYERRRNGVVLPLFVLGACLLFHIPLLTSRDYTPWAPISPLGLGGGIVVNVAMAYGQWILVFPPLFALIVGCGLKKSESRRKDFTMNPYLAIRPMDSHALVGAKLRMAFRSAVLAWLAVAPFVVLWLLLPAGSPDDGRVAPLGAILLERATPDGVIRVALALLALFGLTWKNQVNWLAVDFSGHPLFAYGYPALLTLLGTAYIIHALTMDPYSYPEYLAMARTGAIALLFVKGVVGTAILACSIRKRIVPARTLRIAGGRWLCVGAGAVGLAHAALSGGIGSLPWIAVGVALALPLVRLSAAPIALNANRHR